MIAATPIATADQLSAANIQLPCEFVRGELRMMSPGNAEHGWVIMNISAPLAAFVKQHGLGYVFGAETGFVIERKPDSVLAPDVAFVRRDRVAGPIPKKFFFRTTRLGRGGALIHRLHTCMSVDTIQGW